MIRPCHSLPAVLPRSVGSISTGPPAAPHTCPTSLQSVYWMFSPSGVLFSQISLGLNSSPPSPLCLHVIFWALGWVGTGCGGGGWLGGVQVVSSPLFWTKIASFCVLYILEFHIRFHVNKGFPCLSRELLKPPDWRGKKQWLGDLLDIIAVIWVSTDRGGTRMVVMWNETDGHEKGFWGKIHQTCSLIGCRACEGVKDAPRFLNQVLDMQWSFTEKGWDVLDGKVSFIEFEVFGTFIMKLPKAGGKVM